MDSVGMNRRSFLKILGISAAVLAIDPLSAISNLGYPHFNPRKQYGRIYLVTDPIRNKAEVKTIINVMDQEICEVIPVSYRDKVKYVIKNPKPTSRDPLAQRGEVGWIYNSDNFKKKINFI